MIGIHYIDKKTVSETFHLLKISWDWYIPGKSYDVVIAYKNEVPDFRGPVIDLTANDVFKKIWVLLNDGQPHLHEPLCDIALDDLRRELKKYTILVEIPPAPWDYSYMIALTHDVDITSVRQSRMISVLYAAWQCILQLEFRAGLRIILAKSGIGNDPWDLFGYWKSLESRLGVCSTFYFVPFKETPGVFSHPYRAVPYDIDPEILRDLIAGGWEVGVHGIDNWSDVDRGTAELERVGVNGAGNRTHWLLFNNKSWTMLDAAGYSYDTTFGYNDDAGFRAGTTQVYRPEGVFTLLELPMHIQDVGLFGKFCWALTDNGWKKTSCLNLSDHAAMDHCDRIFGYARKYGGAITVLWHYENITPPRDWSEMYSSLVKRAKDDGAWVTTAKDVVNWFRSRRDMQIRSFVDGKKITIHIQPQLHMNEIPFMKVRVHIDPSLISHIDAEYKTGDQYVDIKCDRSEIIVVLQ